MRSRKCTGFICRGYSDVVDADLSKYFDTIPHSELMQSVARRIVDRRVLRLIKLWLKAPIEERDGDGKRRMIGGKSNTRGTPQGGVVSPLLANIYMNRFLKHWRLSGCGEAFRARVIAYADDFVILSRGHAAEALAWTKAVMTRLGLTLNEAKTSLRECPTGTLRLPRLLVRPPIVTRRTANGTWAQARPRRACNGSRRRCAICWCPAITIHGRKCATTLNRSLRGWSNYFCYGTRRAAFRSVDHYVRERVRALPRQTAQGGRARQPPVLLRRRSIGERGVLCLERLP